MEAGRPSRRGAGLPLFLAVAALVVAVVAVLVWRGADDPYVAPRPEAAPTGSAPGEAGLTLDRLTEAIGDGDRGAALDLAADPDGPGGDVVAALAVNARRVGLTDVSLRYLAETSGVVDGLWTAMVQVTWRAAGFDDEAASAEVPFVFADGGAAVAAIGAGEDQAGGGRVPVWMTGPLDVRRTGDVLVLASRAADGRFDRWVRQASVAIDEVGQVLTGPARLVVEVPASAAALDRALAVEPGTYQDIAAVTAPVDGSAADGAPVHVFLNPEQFDGLDRTASQVVLTHETVHVVTDAPARVEEPLWLVEGFADYVALRDVDLPLSTTAGQVAQVVRRSGVPDALPSDADFGTRETHLGASYEAAWLACRVLAERGGQDALVSLYQQGEDPSALDPALRELFGWSPEDLLTAWQDELEALPR